MKDRIMSIKERLRKKKADISDAYLAAMAAVTIFLSETGTTYAAGSIGDTIRQGLDKVYGQIFMIVTPLFALIVIIGCARIFVNNGRKVDGIVDWLKRAAIAYIAILLIAEIIGFIKTLAGGGSSSILGL